MYARTKYIKELVSRSVLLSKFKVWVIWPLKKILMMHITTTSAEHTCVSPSSVNFAITYKIHVSILLDLQRPKAASETPKAEAGHIQVFYNAKAKSCTKKTFRKLALIVSALA